MVTHRRFWIIVSVIGLRVRSLMSQSDHWCHKVIIGVEKVISGVTKWSGGHYPRSCFSSGALATDNFKSCLASAGLSSTRPLSC